MCTFDRVLKLDMSYVQSGAKQLIVMDFSGSVDRYVLVTFDPTSQCQTSVNIVNYLMFKKSSLFK